MAEQLWKASFTYKKQVLSRVMKVDSIYWTFFSLELFQSIYTIIIKPLDSFHGAPSVS